jgi:hypothetical protein
MCCLLYLQVYSLSAALIFVLQMFVTGKLHGWIGWVTFASPASCATGCAPSVQGYCCSTSRKGCIMSGIMFTQEAWLDE